MHAVCLCSDITSIFWYFFFPLFAFAEKHGRFTSSLPPCSNVKLNLFFILVGIQMSFLPEVKMKIRNKSCNVMIWNLNFFVFVFSLKDSSNQNATEYVLLCFYRNLFGYETQWLLFFRIRRHFGRWSGDHFPHGLVITSAVYYGQTSLAWLAKDSWKMMIKRTTI